MITQSSRLLDAGQRLDQLRIVRDRHFSNRKIFNRTQGVDTIVGLSRQFPFAQHIVLFPGR